MGPIACTLPPGGTDGRLPALPSRFRLAPMTPFQRRLSVRTRDPAFLTRATIFILAVFALSAAWIVRTRPVETGGGANRLPVLLEVELPDDDATILQWARTAALAAMEAGPPDASGSAGTDLRSWAARRIAKLPEPRRPMFEDYLRAMSRGASPDVIQAVLDRGRQSPPAEVPLTMAGDVLRFHGSYPEALDAYERAAAAGTGSDCRLQALRLCEARGWADHARRLLADSGWSQALDSADYRTRHDVALLTGDWMRLIRLNATELLHADDDPDLLLLTVLTGFIWFVCIHKGLGIPGRYWWTGGLALVGGIASTVLTLLILSFQKGHDVWLPAGGQNAWQVLLEHVAGTGLREETSKLALFALLIPLLLRASDARIMAAASCTGLGFAIEENLGYFSGANGAIVWSRFLSANFLHLSLTGLTGLALVRMIRRPNRYSAEFAAMFLTAVAAHGLWNFALTAETPGFQAETRDLQFIVALALAWFYFQTMSRCRDSGRNIVSPHGFFVLSTAMLLGIVLNYSVWHHGGAEGTRLVMVPALGTILQTAVFFRMLRDS